MYLRYLLDERDYYNISQFFFPLMCFTKPPKITEISFTIPAENHVVFL